MKAYLETTEVEYRGVILESETPEEKEVLASIWNNRGRAVARGRLMGNQVRIVIAQTPELGGV